MLTDDDGKFMWPGFGENFRALKWILERCEGSENVQFTQIGLIPDEIDCEGIDVSDEVKEELFDVNCKLWQQEIKEIETFYAKLDYVPDGLEAELDALKKRVNS